MRLRRAIVNISLWAALTAGTALGIGVAVFSAPIPAFAWFSGDILVSWRGGGDSYHTPVSAGSDPKFYTTAVQGRTSDGQPGRLPTGVWAPGDAWQRSLVIKNQHPTNVMGLSQLEVTLTGDTTLAQWLTLTVTGPGNQVLYQGALANAAATTVQFGQPVALNPGAQQTLYFSVRLDRNTTNPWQGKTVQANFQVDAVALTSPMVIDIKPNSWPNGIGVGANGVLPVAINGSSQFNVNNLDWQTARFGPNQIAPLRSDFEDWNHDGFMDMTLKFDNTLTGIACGMTTATLTIQSYDGVTFQGSDAVNPQPCP
jgi:hypothetical protein